MSTIVTRSGKGSPLTHVEVDANFTNLNTDKYQEGSAIGAVTPAAGTFTTLTATGQTSLGGVTDSESLRALAIAGATRYLTAQGSVSGDPTLSASGPAGSNVNLSFYSRGTGSVRFGTNSSITNEQMRVSHTASAVNYVQVTGAATGAIPTISMQGSDTNIGVGITSKGSSSVRFFTNNSGSEQFRVVHTAGTIVNQATVTGSATGNSPIFGVVGSDTNIDLNLTPKGTGTVVANGPLTATGQTSLGGVAGSESLRVISVAGATRYMEVNGSVSSNILTYARASSGSPGFVWTTVGSGVHSFATGSSASNSQFQVSHTASAVNYVQVTGAATTGRPIISAQGSDTNVSLGFDSKGTGTHVFRTSGVIQFQVLNTASAVNYGTITGSATGVAPVFGVAGTDTNIDLALTPKGTGLVRFGTYTAGAPAATGYISIKAADGTTYKVLVGT